MKLAELASRLDAVRSQVGQAQAAVVVQRVDLTAAVNELAQIRALLTQATADLAAARADLAAIKTAFNAHAANNQRHTGTLIGGLL